MQHLTADKDVSPLPPALAPGLTGAETEELFRALQASRDAFGAMLREHERRLRLIGDTMPEKAPHYQALVAAHKAFLVDLDEHLARIEGYQRRRGEAANREWSAAEILAREA